MNLLSTRNGLRKLPFYCFPCQPQIFFSWKSFAMQLGVGTTAMGDPWTHGGANYTSWVHEISVLLVRLVCLSTLGVSPPVCPTGGADVRSSRLLRGDVCARTARALEFARPLPACVQIHAPSPSPSPSSSPSPSVGRTKPPSGASRQGAVHAEVRSCLAGCSLWL